MHDNHLNRTTHDPQQSSVPHNSPRSPLDITRITQSAPQIKPFSPILTHYIPKTRPNPTTMLPPTRLPHLHAFSSPDTPPRLCHMPRITQFPTHFIPFSPLLTHFPPDHRLRPESIVPPTPHDIQLLLEPQTHTTFPGSYLPAHASQPPRVKLSRTPRRQTSPATTKFASPPSKPANWQIDPKITTNDRCVCGDRTELQTPRRGLHQNRS